MNLQTNFCFKNLDLKVNQYTGGMRLIHDPKHCKHHLLQTLEHLLIILNLVYESDYISNYIELWEEMIMLLSTIQQIYFQVWSVLHICNNQAEYNIL